MMNFTRIIRHLITGQLAVKQAFPPPALTAIEAAIAHSEATHSGEIVFAVEASLDLPLLLRNQPIRERAIDVFSLLRVWDTRLNNGVLIYVLLADHWVEIVADRGIHAKVDQAVWESVCETIKSAFRQKQFEQGVLCGIEIITLSLQQFFPPTTIQAENQLPNKPVVL